VPLAALLTWRELLRRRRRRRMNSNLESAMNLRSR
jgi:hypothetical protein